MVDFSKSGGKVVIAGLATDDIYKDFDEVDYRINPTTGALKFVVNGVEYIRALGNYSVSSVVPASAAATKSALALVFPNGASSAGNIAPSSIIGNTNTARSVLGVSEPLFQNINGLASKANTFAIASGGGLIASVVSTNATGVLNFPKVIDFTKTFRCACLLEYNSGTGTTKVSFQKSANVRSGVNITIANGAVYVAIGFVMIHNAITTNVANGDKFWLSIVGDGSFVTISLLKDATRYGIKAATTNDANTDFYNQYATNYTEGGNTTFDAWDQCKVENSSATTKILSVFVTQENKYFGFPESRMQVPAIIKNTSPLGDVTTVTRIPKQYNGINTTDLIMYMHPNASDENRAQTSNAPDLGAAMAYLVDKGYIVTSCLGTDDGAGTYTGAEASNWGAYGGLKFRHDVIQWCLTNFPGIRNIYVVGESMGFLNSLSLQITYPGLVKAMVGISGVTNLSYAYNSEGFSSVINTGHGTASIGVIADKDPNLRAELFKNIPIKIWHGTADSTISKTQHADLFKTNVEAAGGTQISVESVSGAGHINVAGLYDGPAMYQFFQANT